MAIIPYRTAGRVVRRVKKRVKKAVEGKISAHEKVMFPGNKARPKADKNLSKVVPVLQGKRKAKSRAERKLVGVIRGRKERK